MAINGLITTEHTESTEDPSFLLVVLGALGGLILKFYAQTDLCNKTRKKYE